MSTNSYILPSPGVMIGLPNRFPDWYPGQEDLFDALQDWYRARQRFIGVSVPTGSGKSLSAMLLARLSGAKRVIILTSTKGLQNQLIADFGSMAKLVIGQNNFECALNPALRADEGSCHEGIPCPYRAAEAYGCPYVDQLREATKSRIVIANYSYFLAQCNFSTGIGEFDLMVCDEAHDIFKQLEGHMETSISNLDLEPHGVSFPNLPHYDPVIKSRRGKKKKEADAEDPERQEILMPDYWAIWQSWAESAGIVLSERIADLEAEVAEYKRNKVDPPIALLRLLRAVRSSSSRIDRIAGADDDWIVERTNHGYRFTPRWVAQYGNRLFQDIPKIMLMSAILSHKTADSIGVPSPPSERSWYEMGSHFPPENTPIVHIPTVRLNYRADDFAVSLWQSRIDHIIQRRMDRKGILFAVSYARGNLVMQRSRFKNIMMTHSTRDVTYVVNQFKSMKPPALLVSPSVTTGFDFKGLDYIIIGKLPYPDTSGPVMQARHADDPEWTSFLAMDTLIQSSGRGTRSPEDKCEVLIIDDSFVWYWNRYSKFAPKWFRDRVKGTIPSVPDPLI